MKLKNEDKEEKWGYVCGGEKTWEKRKEKEQTYGWKKMKREEKIKLRNVTTIFLEFFHNKF